MKITRMTVLTVVLLLVGVAVVSYGTFVWYVNDVETVSYDVVTSEGEFEIRDYPALIVAEIVRRGERRTAVNDGFRPLATYIFAKERDGEPIAMTAPVTQETDDVGQTWTVRFVMPAEYTLESLPNPENADIQLVEVPAGRRVAIIFSGTATDEMIAQKEELLRAWMQQRGVEPVGPATYAYYNAPFIPGFMKRNEVLFEIAGS